MMYICKFDINFYLTSHFLDQLNKNVSVSGFSEYFNHTIRIRRNDAGDVTMKYLYYKINVLYLKSDVMDIFINLITKSIM